MSVRCLVFVEESGANTQMTRRYAWSPVGQRLVCPVPQGHYQTSKTTTLIAAVRLKGPQAPWLSDGPMDGELFLARVKQGLVPVPQRNDVGILKICPRTKWRASWGAIEVAGARLECLPPYSPDLNLIENLLSKVKQGLNSREPRTARQLFKAAGAAFNAVTP